MVAEIPYVHVKNRWGGEHLRRSYKGEDNPFYGKHHAEETKVLLSKPRKPFIRSEEHKENISLALRGKKKSAEHTRKNRESHLGIKHTEEWKREHSRQLKGKVISPFTEEHKNNISKAKKGKSPPPFSDEHRRRIGEANHRRWQRPGFAEKILAKLRRRVKPTKPEKYLEELLNEYFPSEWKYVGDGKLIIEKKNPDFVNCNGKKLLIELFGDYWHKKDEEYQKQQFYKQYGFGCLIIWQSELADPETVIEKVKDFSDG